MKAKVGSIVAVTWEDAIKRDASEEPLTEALPTVFPVSYGQVVQCPKDYLVIASEVFPDGSARDITTIPVAMVRKVKVLR